MKKLIAFALSLLLLCAAFGAPAEGFPFATFGEARINNLNNRTVYSAYSCATVAQKDGKTYRVEAAADDRVTELFSAINQAAEAGEDYRETFNVLDEYVNSLPVTAVEEITTVPLTREEMDALAGKTLTELGAEGFFYFTPYVEPGEDVTVEVIRDCYVYSAQMEESYEEFSELLEKDAIDGMTVKRVEFNCMTPNRMVAASSSEEAEYVEETEEPEVPESSADAEPPVFRNFGEAEDASVSCQYIRGYRNTAIVKKGEKLYEVVAAADETAVHLKDATLKDYDRDTAEGWAAYEAAQAAFNAYIRTLPVTEVYEITDVPLTREEMDALAGKTLKEVSEGGYCYLYILEEGQDVVFELSRGHYVYRLTVSESWETVSALEEKGGNYDDLTVRQAELRYLYAY